ncbi:hypothetical protein OKW21_002066 [Catalinimonas alkaloidigena]|uniref:helix-hairpin-helix domain-containing protein n=1 Tax=Catalinimonas alkaloidigena TaxID=1075417 RepID=UPI0024062CA9|nr:helix-hairpin-helix domain-containing protein [Catalinimonas alkaloidigena]MDF9796803.1 hypothetical protein [Catalinimonas alkaloidigena]
MGRNRRWWLIFLIIGRGFTVYAQEYSSLNLEKVLENVLQNQYEEGVEGEQLYENLIQFYQEPLNLNSASASDLRRFFFLSERQINNIIKYREYYGLLLSKYELAVIPSLDEEVINALLPFIHIKPPENRRLSLLSRLKGADNRYFIIRQSSVLEAKKGFISTDSILDNDGKTYYEGSPEQLYTRLRISKPGSISLGITMEKDAGETIDWNPAQTKYGADFVSGHFQIERAGPFEQITIGDYSFQSGQQLVFGGGLGLGKGAMTVRSVGRSQYGVKPYTSSTEMGYFRGGTLSWKLPLRKKHLQLTALYSSHAQHAKIHSDLSNQTKYFNSFDLSGMHRNRDELLDKNSVHVTSTGTNLHYANRFQNLQAGINLLFTTYSLPLIPTSSLYKKYDFEGNNHEIGSVYYSYQYQHWYSFAEFALSGTNQYAFLAGVSGALNSYVESVWLYRNYSKGFYSQYGNAFGENTRNVNEEGLYWGLKIEPLAKLTLGAYYDVFRFPWLKYRVDAPSTGYEYLLRADYQLNRNTKFVLQFREENKGINVSSDTLLFRSVGEGVRKNMVFLLDHDINERFGLKTRIHSSSFSLADSLTNGWVVAQDISYSLGRWKADSRIALINTDDYNNRQYLYENDLLYTFSVPAYAGHGIKYYLLLRYKINRHISSWARLDRIMYDDREVIGRGKEEIQARHRTQLRTQIMINF